MEIKVLLYKWYHPNVQCLSKGFLVLANFIANKRHLNGQPTLILLALAYLLLLNDALR